MACACAGTALAGPAGPVVSAGRASYDPATLTVTATSAHTHIGWQSFNVAAGEVVNFVQPNAQSSVLNLIFNPQSLSILGGLRSNGSVLFMTDGRVSGSDANLNLAGMISSSLRLPKLALALGRGGAPQAQPLTTLADGSIYVISEDEQAVTTASGDVVLNPGKAVELAHASMPSLRVGLTAPDAEAINLSRLVASKRETGIFAGLFRMPAAARRAVQRDVEPVMTASAQAPFTDDERFNTFALLYTQVRREALRRDAGMMQVAALSGSGVFLRGAKSRPSLLPRDIRIGAPMAPAQDEAVRAADLPVPAEPESPAAAPALAFASAEPPAEMAAVHGPQPVALAFASAEPPAEIAAARSPQPVALAFISAEPPAEMAATRSAQPVTLAFASAEPPADTVVSPELRANRAAEGSEAEAEPATTRRTPRSSQTAIVVALAQHTVAPAPQQGVPAKEVLIERRAPRYFTDYRGALFFM